MIPDTTRELIASIRGLSPTAGDAVGIAQALNRQAAMLDDPAADDDLRKILDACTALLDMTDAPERMLRAHGYDLTDVRRQARHELRTPINAIKGYGEMLVEDAQEGINSILLPDLRRLIGVADGLLLDIDGLFRASQASADASVGSHTGIAMPGNSPVKHSGPQGRILAVDDMPENLDILSRRLERLGHSVVTTTSGNEALQLLQKEDFDLVLLDLMMPEISGFEVLSRIKSAPQTADIPVVMISALNETASVVLCLDAGAEDYLTKPFEPTLLRARVSSCLERKRLRDIERIYMKRLETYARIDGLTNITNRRSFDETLDAEWNRSQRSGAPLALVMLDIDHFKLYNDNYGHGAGDACLRKVAAALAGAVVRSGDLVARYGGEEFVVLLPNTDEEGAAKIAEHLRSHVEALQVPHSHSSVAAWVTISLGAASTVPQANNEPAVLLERADRQLYQAKSNGRNRVCSTVERARSTPPAS